MHYPSALLLVFITSGQLTNPSELSAGDEANFSPPNLTLTLKYNTTAGEFESHMMSGLTLPNVLKKVFVQY